MALRYTDLDTPKSAYTDFVIRRRRPTLTELFIICVGVIIYAASIAIYSSSNDRLALMAVLLTLGGCLCLYAITQVKRSRVLLQATEFENALFSSALGMNHKFCLITHREGNLVYVSPGFKELFTAFTEADGHDLTAWFDAGHIQAEEAAAILKAVSGGSPKELVCHLFGDHHEHRSPYRMLIEPIPRPKGFVLIRCREDANW